MTSVLTSNLTFLFQPKINWHPGEHIMPGGGIPLPPAAAELCQILPPPFCFEGPFVIVERLVEVFNKVQLADDFQGEEKGGNQEG